MNGQTSTDADWEKAFRMIELENNLINHRITALLTLQGFLFAGLIFGSNGLAQGQSTEYRWQLQILLLTLAFVGFVSPLLIRPGVFAAFRQICAGARWLSRRTDRPELLKAYPPIVGHKKAAGYTDDGFDEKDVKAIKNINSLSVGIHQVPGLLMLTWVITFGVLVHCYGWLSLFNWAPISHEQSNIPRRFQMHQGTGAQAGELFILDTQSGKLQKINGQGVKPRSKGP